jgi:hypothetical protein
MQNINQVKTGAGNLSPTVNQPSTLANLSVKVFEGLARRADNRPRQRTPLLQ